MLTQSERVTETRIRVLLRDVSIVLLFLVHELAPSRGSSQFPSVLGEASTIGGRNVFWLRAGQHGRAIAS